MEYIKQHLALIFGANPLQPLEELGQRLGHTFCGLGDFPQLSDHETEPSGWLMTVMQYSKSETQSILLQTSQAPSPRKRRPTTTDSHDDRN